LDRLKKAFKSKFKQQALEGDPKKARINFDDPNPKNLPGKYFEKIKISVFGLG